MKITITVDKDVDVAHLRNSRYYLETKLKEMFGATALGGAPIELEIERTQYLMPESQAEVLAVAQIMFGDDPEVKTIGDVRERAQRVLAEMRKTVPQSVLDDLHLALDELRSTSYKVPISDEPYPPAAVNPLVVPDTVEEWAAQHPPVAKSAFDE
jgi:hypothetical protein